MNNICWQVKSFHELNVDELYKILQARIDVFVVEQDTPYPDLDDYDKAALHLWAEQDGKVLAYCRLFPRNIKYDEASIGRVLTTPPARRKNIGRRMMSLAVQIITARFRTSEIRISAQDYLLNFYKSFGFADTGKKYLEDGIPHTEMIRR